jgi:hypothetical protein
VIFGTLQGEDNGVGRDRGLAVSITEARELISVMAAEKKAATGQ